MKNQFFQKFYKQDEKRIHKFWAAIQPPVQAA